jgi:hypothetical protein
MSFFLVKVSSLEKYGLIWRFKERHLKRGTHPCAETIKTAFLRCPRVIERIPIIYIADNYGS